MAFSARIVASGIAAIALLACSNSSETDWVPLLSDNSLEGWHYFQDDGSKRGWTISDGVLVFDDAAYRSTKTGDASLVSDDVYESFQIQFDWKVSEGANSGFMWGVREDARYDYPYQTGPEIQILDPGLYEDPSRALNKEWEVDHIKGDLEDRVNFTGALYDMSAPLVLDAANSTGEWNRYDITIDRAANRGLVRLNGILIQDFALSGEAWDAMIAKSKFDPENPFWADYGVFETGHIVLQDHPGEISFRDIRIRRLDGG